MSKEENLSKELKKGSSQKPEALWFTSEEMYLIHWEYDYLSMSLNFGDKPYSQLIDLALNVLYNVYKKSYLRIFKIHPKDEVELRTYNEKYPFEFSSVNLTTTSTLILNWFYSNLNTDANIRLSRKRICIMAIKFLRYYIEGNADTIVPGFPFDADTYDIDRRMNWDKLVDIVTAVEDTLFTDGLVEVVSASGKE